MNVDQNVFFNKDTRIFAFDDSPFSRNDRFTNLVGVVMRKDLYLETLVKKKIQVDGNDVTERMLEAINEKGSGVNLIVVKGVTFGGFNILDMHKLYEKAQIPIVNVIDHEPNIAAIKEALIKHFEDWEQRLKMLKKGFEKIDSLYIQTEGVGIKATYKFLKQITINGIIPEPVRIADLIAGLL